MIVAAEYVGARKGATVGADGGRRAAMIWVSAKRRLPLTIALIFGLIVIGAILSVSRGSKPSPGTVYTGTVVVQTPAGTIRGDRPVSFSVGAGARRVRAFRFAGGIPSLCPATAGTTASGAGAIVSPSRFLARLAIRRANRRVGTLTISGDFHTLGHESGALSTRFDVPGLRRCDAGGAYSTRSATL
jgi:hypothetical protein